MTSKERKEAYDNAKAERRATKIAVIPARHKAERHQRAADRKGITLTEHLERLDAKKNRETEGGNLHNLSVFTISLPSCRKAQEVQMV